jgi:hypothetical protein
MAKSILSVFTGFVAIVILSIVTDKILESLWIFPPSSEPLAYTPSMLAVALVYRCMFTVVGGYITARLAPDRPMKHAIILGCFGIVGGTIGVVYAWDLSPEHWYPIALVITAVPCTWLGGKLGTGRAKSVVPG